MGRPMGTTHPPFSYLHKWVGEAFVVLRHTDRWDDPGSPHTAWG